MQIDKRKQLINFFTDCEKKYSVYEWKLAEVNVWLLFKMRIFNSVFQKLNTANNPSKKKKSNLLSLIKGFIPAVIKTYTLRLPKVDRVYCGGKGHRVYYDKDVSFNRYFDPLLDADEYKGISGLLIEYDGGGNLKCYKNARVVDVSKLLNYFLALEYFASIFYTVSTLKEEIKEIDLKDVDTTKGKLINQVKTQVIRINAWKRLFHFILRKTKAKEIHVLCYYANPMFGAILAAKQKGIRSFDMQHGTQGPLHPAYTFTNVKDQAINILPNTFCVWDNAAANHLKSWIKENKNFNVELSGNPWLTFLNQTENLSLFNVPEKKSNRIVVTIQPVMPYLSQPLINCIKSTITKFQWLLRFHPRMNLVEKNAILNVFSIETEQSLIQWDNGNAIPLPLLLINSGLHISKYSGSISEAALVDKKTIVIDEIGLVNYQNLVESGHVVSGVQLDSVQLENLISKLINER